MTSLLSDVRYVVRGLARSRGFAVVATLSLGLGVGANAAMFSTIKNLLRDAIPVERPDELRVVCWQRKVDVRGVVQISSASCPGASGESWRTNYSYPLYRAMRDATREARVFAFNFLRGVSIGVGDGPPMIGGGLLVDGRYFDALRPKIILGRALSDADDSPNAPLVTVIGHAFWMKAFAGDPRAVGTTIRLNGVPVTVVGITAEGFEGLSRGGFYPTTDVTITLSSQPMLAARWSLDGESLFSSERTFWLRVMARVPDDASQDRAREALAAAFRSVASPANRDQGPAAELSFAPGLRGASPVGAETGRMLWILMGVVGIVLLIACVNLASLMLARGVAREREIAVRRALGSGRARLVSQLLLEALVIAIAGTITGLLFLFWTRSTLASLLTSGFGASAFGSIAVQPKIDVPVVLASAVLCVVVTVAFGLLPALRLSRVDPGVSLKHRVAGASGPRLTVGRALIAVQIAVSVPLLVGAGLLLRTMANLDSVALGFDPRGLVMFQLDPAYTRLPSEQHPGLYLRLLDRMRAIPGVRSATLVENPLMSDITSNTMVTLGGERRELYMNAVGPDFVETMGMRLLSGRMPGPRDDPTRPAVGALNEKAVRELFGGASPIGRVLEMGKRRVEIVGVVSDSRYDKQREGVRPTLFDAALQRPGWGGNHIVLRSDLPVSGLEPAIRQAVADIDRDLPVVELRTQLGQMARTTGKERVFTVLLGVFGAFALMLASIGLHGVTSYAISRRTSEIGVRMALGARPASVLWLILRQVTALASIGVLLGVPVAIAAGPLVRGLLYGVAPSDWRAILTASVVMVGVALLAGLQPALRAARVHPLSALRAE